MKASPWVVAGPAALVTCKDATLTLDVNQGLSSQDAKKDLSECLLSPNQNGIIGRPFMLTLSSPEPVVMLGCLCWVPPQVGLINVQSTTIHIGYPQSLVSSTSDLSRESEHFLLLNSRCFVVRFPRSPFCSCLVLH